ncbi:MAG: DNA recombination/repair protein RecA, partial [Anaerolineae bacterium]|nr:DNA recombination/repair protein RecA [Anaerolineae bacterium]
KRGAYFRYGETLLGQGRENSKQYLAENPEMMNRIEMLVRQASGLTVDEQLITAVEEAAAEAEEESEVAA